MLYTAMSHKRVRKVPRRDIMSISIAYLNIVGVVLGVQRMVYLGALFVGCRSSNRNQTVRLS